ncbi:ribonuclease T [uncultured Novosphingobium sp.]|uniref:ribonuclease T2 family protein n=1 Tax=uncultured Novosphingobium sp. TaxID=292277 RepID=UPI0007372966|nr:ribonuclease T [uncultured Novosphingobium sp.]KTR84600.1 ribonuclease T [Novosphingobium barchaimii]
MKALLAIAALLPVPAFAQAYQCAPPTRIEPIPRIEADAPPRPSPISGYTLSASWSPDYCKTSRDTASMQCSGRDGRFGFVLHGLWPESRGPYPQWCATRLAPTPADVRPHLCMTPSTRLLAHEWAKHGSCMAKTPAQYYRAANALWRSIRWFDADRLSRKQDLTAGDLRQEFVRLNPAWKPEQVGVKVSRTGWLREVQLCYSRRFLPERCDRRHFGPADSAKLKIWRGL